MYLETSSDYKSAFYELLVTLHTSDKKDYKYLASLLLNQMEKIGDCDIMHKPLNK